MNDAKALSVREANQQDVALLLDFYRLLEFGPARETSALSLPAPTASFGGYAAYPDFKVYIAEQAGEPVGTFALLIVGTLAHGGRPFGVVEDVVVSSANRRGGVGKEMMRFAMQLCKAADCYKMALSSHLDRSAAHAFYESLGFARHGYSFLVT